MTAVIPRRVRAAVIGAGPTGLTAATLLARHGVPVLVMERHRAPYPLPRAVHLDDEVHRILQAMGIHERFSAISRPARGMRLMDGSHRVLAEFLRDSPRGRHGFPQANMFDQPELEHLLRDNLDQHPSVTLRGGIEVTSVTSPAHRGAPVEVTFRDEDTGVSRTVLADAVLGCDGANSLVRASIGSRMRNLADAQQWLVVDIRCRMPLPAWDGVHQICDPHRAATYMRVGDDRYRWEFRLRSGERPEQFTDRRRLLALIAPWTPGIPRAYEIAPGSFQALGRTPATARTSSPRAASEPTHLTPRRLRLAGPWPRTSSEDTSHLFLELTRRSGRPGPSSRLAAEPLRQTPLVVAVHARRSPPTSRTGGRPHGGPHGKPDLSVPSNHSIHRPTPRKKVGQANHIPHTQVMPTCS